MNTRDFSPAGPGDPTAARLLRAASELVGGNKALSERLRVSQAMLIKYVDVGLKLDVEPTIYLDGDVAIKISLEVSNIISQLQTKAGSVAYQIGTRTAQTVLRLKDGENQILAGLISDEDRRAGDRLPALGDIPVAGRLFGNQIDDSSKTEIVLSITPRIVRNVRRPDSALLEFESGTENSLGVRGVVVTAMQAPTASTPSSGDARGTAAATLVASPQASASPLAGAPAISSSSISIPGATQAAGIASVTWQGPAQLNVGDTFALQFLLHTDQPVVSIPFAVGFDPAMFQAVSVQEGEFLRQGAAQTAFASRVDPKGQVIGTVTRSGTTGAIGRGAVATINFRVASATAKQAQVQMITIAPVGLGGVQVPVAPVPAFSLQLGPAN